MTTGAGNPGLTIALRGFLENLMSEYHATMLIEFLISFICWNVLNLIVMNLKLNDSHLKRLDWLDFRNRIVSIIHGILVLIFSTYNTFFVHSGCGEENTRFE